ncbi:MAG TPA: hypothetical protein VFR58_04695 [Flavisolibacter sp.]|nr:hypothetical protein [Flavisolibacter sp.]
MGTYEINVTLIEELQTLKDTDELDRIFARAKSTIVNGESVVLLRKPAGGKAEKFDELTTLEDLAQYRNRVFRYL